MLPVTFFGQSKKFLQFGPMKIAVIGAGGVGGYFGGKLAKAGNDVTFVARGKHGEAMLQKGLQIKSIAGAFSIPEVKVTNSISELQSPDLILLAVKSWQVKDIRDEIYHILHEQSIVIPLQNGVMAIEELSDKIVKKHLISGLCRIISQVEAPGVINHFGAVPSIVLGELDNQQSERIMNLKQLFSDAEVELKVAEDIQSELWKKFIMICISGLQAVTQTTLGSMRETHATRALMGDLLNEVLGLSQKIGIKLNPDYVDKTLTFLDTLPESTTFSLSRDIWENRPSEMEYQNGTVVKLGERHGFDTPINRFIYSCLLPNELKVRQPSN